MRRLLVTMACVGAIATAQAQLQVLVPTPFGVVMSAGQWLLFNNKSVYYIEVSGQGRTAEEAKLNGFRLAVEQALGSVIASETQSRDSRIQRDEIISYAAGFVERYEIVSTVTVHSGYQVDMRVWVRRTNLAERLLVKVEGHGEIDGARAAVAVDTAQYSRSQGDRILTTVLKDFPTRSFDVQLEPIKVKIDSDRRTWLQVYYTISWNKHYVKSLIAAEKSVSTCGWGGCVMDEISKQLEYDELKGSGPSILLTVLNNAGQPQWRACMDFADLIYYGDNKKYSMIPVNAQELADMARVDIKVVRRPNCP
jgi:hypothetical protein